MVSFLPAVSAAALFTDGTNALNICGWTPASLFPALKLPGASFPKPTLTGEAGHSHPDAPIEHDR